MKSICIVGGGIMGITLGYYLSQQGVKVDIYETSPVLGGLAGPSYLEDGTPIDRFYHAILSSDQNLTSLCKQLNIYQELRFNETKMGFFHQGEIHPMNNMMDFLRFPPLNWIARFRLGLTIVHAQTVKNWKKLESIPVDDWLIDWSGERAYQNLWRPMLRAKFDGGFENTPATYIWARLVRTQSTRKGVEQREMSGHLIGGYATLLKAMAAQIQEKGGEIHLNMPLEEIVIEQGKASGIRIKNGDFYPFSKIIVTVQSPIFKKLIPGAEKKYINLLDKINYLGIICPLLVLDRPLTPYWTLNITDERVPFTGVIETTAYIDPKYVGGHHLVYLPKYTAPDSALQTQTDEQIKEIWLQNLELMFPAFDRNWIRYFVVHREKYVEPLHGLNEVNLIPGIKTPVSNLFLSTTSQIYPELTNGESITRYAANTAQFLLTEADV